MQVDQANAGTSGVFTYALGAFFLWLSRLNLNDWFILLSIVLVVLRIVYDTSEFFARRREHLRKQIANVEQKGE